MKDIKSKKDELVKIRDSRLRGVLLRSRARWVEDGEKVSSYFCAMEKRNYVNKSMNCLNINGKIETDKSKISEAVNDFYKTLYSKIDVQDLNISDLVNEVPQLDQTEAEQLEGELNLEELSVSLKNMKNRKSPGSDGFTVEFFKVFWGKLGGWVLRSLNEGFRRGELSQTQKEGVIICIPKGDNDRDQLKNWRPISLLNIVYKIGSSSIANRIKNVLPIIISEDQTGFIKNRYIGDNIRLIFDIMSWLDFYDQPGLLLCLDFQKAFDSLDWNFLHKSLQAFGFREDICNWINTFHTNIKSTVSINGNITDWFTVSRGCRQGDPLSPYIFIICAEILAIMIRENNLIKGITVNNTEHKITQYADDSEILLEGDRRSFEETINTLDRFGSVSGLLLNTSKTISVWLGSRKNSDVRYMQHLNINWNPPRYKILGIWFTNDLDVCIEINFREKIKEMKRLFSIWLKRQITPLGRIAVLKSLILSKLVYLWILLPNPPDNIVNEIQCLIFEFIWDKKRDRISRKFSCKSISDGGLGIPLVKDYIMALKLSWLRKFIRTNHNWKSILVSCFPNIVHLNDFGSHLPTNNETLSIFWKDVFRAYLVFGRNVHVKKHEDVLAEPIFYNDNVCIGNNVVFFENWYNNGVKSIKEFVDGNGNFLSLNEFNMKHNLNELNFVKYNGCVRAIKTFLRKCQIVLENDQASEFSELYQTLISVPRGAKQYYDIISYNQNTPSFCTKWTNKLINYNLDWKNIFDNVQKIKEVKLRWFQLRIQSRIIGTNIILKNMRLRNDDLCSFCSIEKENIEHLFVECTYTMNFWQTLLTCFKNMNLVEANFKFEKDLLILGSTKNYKISKVLYYVIMVAKYYIYKSRCEGSLPNIFNFRIYLHDKYCVEKYIAMKNMLLDKFDRDWQGWNLFVS